MRVECGQVVLKLVEATSNPANRLIAVRIAHVRLPAYDLALTSGEQGARAVVGRFLWHTPLCHTHYCIATDLNIGYRVYTFTL